MSLVPERSLPEQEAFEKCWAHLPLRAAARRLFYIAIHQVSLTSHAACTSMSTTTTTTTTRDRGDLYGPIEWAQQMEEKTIILFELLVNLTVTNFWHKLLGNDLLQCMGWLWYVAVDFQLYCLSLIIILLIYRLVSPLAGETWTPEIGSFQSCSMLSTVSALACYIFDIYQPSLIIFCKQ